MEATFYDFRDATLQIAQEGLKSGRYQAADVAKVELAWAAIGIADAGADPVARRASGRLRVREPLDGVHVARK